MSRAAKNHKPCPGGCGELADECGCRRPSPLGSMQVVAPVGSTPKRYGAGKYLPNDCSDCREQGQACGR